MRATGAPEMLRQAQARHVNSGLDAKQWDDFLLIYKGDVDKSLTAYIAWADGEVAKLNGVSPPPGDPNVPLIADTADLASLPLAPIAAEMLRLEALFSADKLVRDQYAALTGTHRTGEWRAPDPGNPAHRCARRRSPPKGPSDRA